MNDARPDPFLRRWLTTSGGALVVLAGVVMMGRFAGIQRLVTVFSDGAAMAFPTVLALLLAGIAFVAFGQGRYMLGRALALILLLFGVAALAWYIVPSPFGLKLSVFDPVRVAGQSVGFNGRTSSNSALALIALATGFLLLSAPHLRAQLAAFTIAVLLAISLFAIVSYATGLRYSVEWWRYTSMAVHAAAAFCVGGLALLVWLMRRIAMAQKVVNPALPFFVVSGTAILVLGAVVFVSNEQRADAARGMNRTLEVDAAIDRFIASVARFEGATRAFALTGDEQYINRVEVHRQSVTAAAAALDRLTIDNPSQHERAVALQPLVVAKFLVNEAQVRARRERGVAAAAAELQREPPEIMTALRAATDGLAREERRVQAHRRFEAALNEARLSSFLLSGGIVTLALVGVAFSLVLRGQRHLARANDELEDRVRQRTAELEQSAVRLGHSERRFRFLADTMPQLVWTARTDGSIESLNKGWLDFLGAATEAEGIEIVPSRVHPDDYAHTATAWGEMQRGSRSAGGELRLQRADGTYRWHLWRAHPEHGPNEEVVRWVGTCTDIHDQKLAEEQLELRVNERTVELRSSEERFRQAFDFAGIGMAIVGLDGRWMRVNKSICDLLGYSDAELRQKTVHDVTEPADATLDSALIAELVDGGRRSYQIEKRYFHRDGRLVRVRLTVSLIREAGGQPVHFVLQIEDVTARKQLEENLANARDQALEASRLKSEFLATMSHEIRTPMNAVIGMTTLLRDTPLTTTQADYLHTIESSGEALLTIINDILDYSKIEAGRIELEITPFVLRQCVEDALDLFAGRAFEKKLELAYLMGAGVPAMVAGDASRLRQILVNLLGNALKFTQRGEVVIAVKMDESPGPLGLHFTVQDTGIGIAADGMERLFKSFSQVDASTTRRFGGTGLGLAISKRLVEAMGGKMWAESEIGKGSTFHFTVAVHAHEPLAEPLLANVPELQGRGLLVVDDNATSRRVIAELAREWGMTVREAASGREALALLTADPSCAVGMIGLQLPDMEGEQLAQNLHSLPGCETLPLVLLTSMGRRVRSPEFAQILAKPIKAEALRAVIQASLRRQYSTGKSRAPFPAASDDGTLGQRCPLRVLIAEDNAVNQRVASLLLQRLGYRATVVANGTEAFAAMEIAEYDAILMDVEMPEVDGCEATRRIRALRQSPNRPWIIALTAGAMDTDRDRAIRAGMNDFLSKPVRTDALSAALERAHSGVIGDR